MQSNLRREERRNLEMYAKLRTSHECIVVQIRNITQYGCQILGNWVFLKQNTRIMLRPDGFESFASTVRWVLPEKAGIEFDRPLHPAVVDHLCLLYPAPHCHIEIQPPSQVP